VTAVKLDEGHVSGRRGLRIFTRSWRPAGAPRAVVVVVHGFNAHSGRYAWADRTRSANVWRVGDAKSGPHPERPPEDGGQPCRAVQLDRLGCRLDAIETNRAPELETKLEH
jgi:hypothetical protein